MRSHETNGSPSPASDKKRDELVALLRRRYEAADRVRRGVCLLNAGQFDEASKSFNRARELGSVDQSLPTYLAAGLLGQGDPAAAADEWHRQALSDENPATAHIREALALRSAGDADGAIDRLREAVREHPECGELHFQLGTLLAALDRCEEAELRFTQAVSIDREHAEALVSLGLCCAARESPAEALTFFQRAQALRPFDARIGWLLAEAAKAVRQQGLAVRVKAALGSDEPVQDERGIAELSQIIERDPEFVDAFLSIPAGAVDEDIFAVLLRTLQIALERQPEHAELHYHCGRVLDRLGRRGDAISENERAVQIDPGFTRALIELGKLYHATDRTDDATTRLEQAIRAGAEYADVYYLLGNLYRDQGEVGRARTAYRRALVINERYEAAQKALSELAA